MPIWPAASSRSRAGRAFPGEVETGSPSGNATKQIGRKRGQLVPLRLGRFGFVPKPVHLSQGRLLRQFPLARERALDAGKAALEFGVGGAQRCLRINLQMPGEVNDG